MSMESVHALGTPWGHVTARDSPPAAASHNHIPTSSQPSSFSQTGFPLPSHQAAGWETGERTGGRGGGEGKGARGVTMEGVRGSQNLREI